MKSLLIKDTTQDERRRIVEESLGMLGGCDDCMSGLADITMSFRTEYTAAMNGPERTGCNQ